MKKIVAMMMAAVACFTMTSCGGDDDNTATPQQTETVTYTVKVYVPTCSDDENLLNQTYDLYVGGAKVATFNANDLTESVTATPFASSYDKEIKDLATSYELSDDFAFYKVYEYSTPIAAGTTVKALATYSKRADLPTGYKANLIVSTPLIYAVSSKNTEKASCITDKTSTEIYQSIVRGFDDFVTIIKGYFDNTGATLSL